MYIAICDDETAFLEQILSFCLHWEAESGFTLQKKIFHSAEELLANWGDGFDLLLLDICMDGISGMEAARQIRRTDPAVRIVFITNMLGAAIEGYEVKASHFIVKPITYAEFSKTMDTEFTEWLQTRSEFLALQTTDGIKRVRLSDIIYVESGRNRSYVHCCNTVYDVRATISDLTRSLEKSHFFRVHSGFLVNLREIRSVGSNTLAVSNGDTILLSRHRKKEFMTELNNFFGDRLI